MRKFFKIIFSRYTVCAVFILIELAIMAVLSFVASEISGAFALIGRVISLAVFVSLINKDTNPEFKLTWLAIAAISPVFGSVLYLVFSSRQMTVSEKGFLSNLFCRIREAKNGCKTHERTAAALDALSKESFSLAGRAYSVLGDDPLAELYPSGVLSYYRTGEDMYSAMLSAIEQAKSYIFLEYFIIEEGEMWQGIYDVLVRKAEKGVDVRILYDDIGTMSTLPQDFDKKLRRIGIKCYRFAKITPALKSSHNNRDHRKICVVDGEIAFTGGMNVADEYVNKKRRFGNWKDGGIGVRGGAARGFACLFLSLYDMTVRAFSDYDSFLAAPEESAEWNGGYVIPFGSGPQPMYSEPVGKNALIGIIGAAERYLYVTTPYLIVDYDLTEALRRAARRGVDVRIITPAIPDKKMIKIMTKSSYPYLIRAGVRIFEYTPGFIHEKCVVCDDTVAMVGTINLDYRSLVHHFEDALLIFRDPVIEDIRNGFLETEGKSVAISGEAAKLSFSEKALRNVMRIIAPLL